MSHIAGILKSGILSAIKSCRLSGARGEFGQLRIEAEELHRELAENTHTGIAGRTAGGRFDGDAR
jgi:hypothetical protein